MTADQRQALIQRSLADLVRRGSGWVLFVDKDHGDNYVEIGSDDSGFTIAPGCMYQHKIGNIDADH